MCFVFTAFILSTQSSVYFQHKNLDKTCPPNYLLIAVYVRLRETVRFLFDLTDTLGRRVRGPRGICLGHETLLVELFSRLVGIDGSIIYLRYILFRVQPQQPWKVGR